MPCYFLFYALKRRYITTAAPLPHKNHKDANPNSQYIIQRYSISLQRKTQIIEVKVNIPTLYLLREIIHNKILKHGKSVNQINKMLLNYRDIPKQCIGYYT